MQKELRIETLYEGIITGDELTTKNLNALGFKPHDITDLVASDTITRVKRGSYALKNVNDFLAYVNQKHKNKIINDEKKKELYEYCLNLEPDNNNIIFVLFVYAIKEENYDKAITYLETLMNGEENYLYNNDYNLYLFILDKLCTLPEELKNKVAMFTIDDIRVLDDDIRYEDNTKINEIRNMIFYENYGKANYQLQKQPKVTYNEYATVALLNKYFKELNKKNNPTKYLLSLVKEHDYEATITRLKELANNHTIINREEILLMICEKYLEIKNTNQVPPLEKTKTPIKSVYKAVAKNDFTLALYIGMEFCKTNNMPVEESYIVLALQDINKLIKELKANQELSNPTFTELSKEEIKKLIIDCNYEALLNYLETKKTFKDIQLSEEILMVISNKYLAIKETRTIPFKKENNDFNVLDALMNDDYDQALKLSIKYCEKHNYAFDNNYIYLSILNLINLVNSIKEENKINVLNPHEITIDEIYMYLKTNDLDNAFILIHNYLENNNLASYERTIINLIKLSIIDNDLTFARPIQILSTLKNGYEPNLLRFYNYCKEALNRSNINEAKLYLEILNDLKAIYSSNISLEGIKKQYSLNLRRQKR